MRNAMMNIWNDLDDNMRKEMIGGFRKRLRDCVKNKGRFSSLVRKGTNHGAP